MNLVVVEKDNTLTGKLEELLRGSGECPHVKSFTGFTPALNFLENNTPCVLLLDLEFPNESVSDILLKVRGRAPGVPVVLITPAEKESEAFSAIGEGVQDYLIRDRYTADSLRHCIRLSWERKHAEGNLNQALSDLRFALASEKVLLEELDRRNKELVELSITDGLTGLYNHRFIQERFDFEIKRARRYGANLSCMLIDIDHFKMVNDTYGHQFGDLVLSEIAGILKKNSREVDICGRYGGEEFMIITNQPVEGALQYATKLHAAVEKHLFQQNDVTTRITISIGISGFRRDVLRKQQMIERADKALYRAKADGRNLIRVWKDRETETVKALDKGGIQALKDKFDHLSSMMRATYMESTYALLRAIDAKDHYTQEHSQNVSRYAVMLAQQLGLCGEETEVLRYAGLLHDIGKIGVNQEILTKTGPLTREEFTVLKKHPVIGVSILNDVKFLEKEIPIILHHHERFDGSGYPHGLRGREIPLGARILAVVDAFDAITTDRRFQAKSSARDALKEIESGKGTQFAPDIVDAFVRGADSLVEKIHIERSEGRI